MKKKYIIISIVTGFIILGMFFLTKIDFDNLIRMPVMRNVIFYNNDINIKLININGNYVYIKGELNTEENNYLEVYTIENVDVQKVKDKLYITVTGGYGTGEEYKKFSIDEQFDGEEINKVILKGKRMSSKVIWEKRK